MRGGLRVWVGVCVLVLGGVVVCGVPASGAGDGLWYYTDTGVAAAHQGGVDGSGVTVAVIDSPINMKVAELRGADVTPMEPSGCRAKDGSGSTPVVEDSWRARHGTEMAALLVGNGKAVDGSRGIQGVAPGVKVLYYANHYDEHRDSGLTCYTSNGNNIKGEHEALIERAIDDGADIISISQARKLMSPSFEDVLMRAFREGVIVVAATDDRNILDVKGIGYPGQANGVVAVSAVDPRMEVKPEVRESVQITVVAPGREVWGFNQFESASSVKYRLTEGSSIATVWTAGVLALVWSKYPEANGNQILQTLIRNTGGKTHEPKFLDGFSGYGYVSVPAMLADDPLKYEAGYNPLFVGTKDQKPSIEELAEAGVPLPEEYGGTTPTPTPTTANPTPPPGPEPDPVNEDGVPVWVIITIAVMVVLAIGGVVTAIAISHKHRRHQSWPQQMPPRDPQQWGTQHPLPPEGQQQWGPPPPPAGSGQPYLGPPSPDSDPDVSP